MVELLQVLVSLLFFGNKVLVLVGKKFEKFGWLLGVIAASLGVAYFYLLGMYVYTVLEIGLIVLMSYGFLHKDTTKNEKVETTIRVVTGVVMLVLACVVFSGAITIIEFVSSIFMLAGTYLLTHSKKRLGWILYGIAHLAAVYLGYAKGQQFFADFQLASAIVSAVGALIIKDPHD